VSGLGSSKPVFGFEIHVIVFSSACTVQDSKAKRWRYVHAVVKV